MLGELILPHAQPQGRCQKTFLIQLHTKSYIHTMIESHIAAGKGVSLRKSDDNTKVSWTSPGTDSEGELCRAVVHVLNASGLSPCFMRKAPS